MNSRDVRTVSEVRAIVASGRLREARERLRLSQRELADAAGVSVASLSSWDVGRRLPSADNALKLADAFFALGVRLGGAA